MFELKKDDFLEFENRPENELLVDLFIYWGINNSIFELIGSYEKAISKEGEIPYGYFNNVRSPFGDLLFYPNKGSRVKIRCPHKDEYQKFPIWTFIVKLAKSATREKHTSPFLLSVQKAIGEASPEIQELVRKKIFIEHLHEVTLGGHPVLQVTNQHL